MHRLQQALREHGAAPAALPDGCEPGSVPQQLRAAVDALMCMLQVRGIKVAALGTMLSL